MRPREIFDAHHHFWNLSGGEGHYPWLQDQYDEDFFLGDYRAMCHDFLPDDLRARFARWNLTGSVHVEAERSRREQVAETRWLAELHGQAGLPTLIVGHVYFVQPDRDEVLADHAACPLVRGIRSKPVIAARPGLSVRGEPGSLQDPQFAEGLSRLERHGFSWDLRVPFWHLAEAAELVAQFPRIPVVLNHLGLPLDRSPEALAVWRRGMELVAAQPQVMLKVSEMGLHGGRWDAPSNRTVIRDAVAIFGIERCMFASNLPVSGLSVPLDDLVETVLAALPDASQPGIDGLFAGNARRFYRADPA
jgi:predicted TIM-barrel fold metal-dependent hydrolase